MTLFVLYLMQNPDVQRKAQEEIDRVVGRDRLPTWEDTRKLSYVRLVLQETYRMNPLSPLGIPHASIKDDIYDGMFIPKGTIVYQNVWAMTHDPAVYAEPFRFRPERYLPREEGGNGEPFPVGNFGFGRRYVPHVTLPHHHIDRSGSGQINRARLPNAESNLVGNLMVWREVITQRANCGGGECVQNLHRTEPCRKQPPHCAFLHARYRGHWVAAERRRRANAV